MKKKSYIVILNHPKYLSQVMDNQNIGFWVYQESLQTMKHLQSTIFLPMMDAKFTDLMIVDRIFISQIVMVRRLQLEIVPGQSIELS